MAALYYSHSAAEQPLTKLKPKPIKISPSIPRRKVTLIYITLLLNVLIWSAIVCLVTSLYQIVSDPRDITNVAPVVLTLTSALATIAYTFIHTVFSLKQKTWEQQQRHTLAAKKTSYVAIRLVISLCILWLLTTGWNMIIVARRPVCLDEAPGLQGWESGSTCLGGRVGIAFAAISLYVEIVPEAWAKFDCFTRATSCALFGVLAVVNRPFEAHLFRHGYQKPARIPGSPQRFFGLPPTESRIWTPEKSTSDRYGSASIHRNRPLDTINRSTRLAPPTMSAPSRVRSSDSRIFTSPYAPPPIPAAYMATRRNSSADTSGHSSYLPMHRGALTRPPRLSGTARNPEAVPLFVPAQYSMSTWRAIHPGDLASVPLLTHSYPPVRNIELSYHSQYSYSSVCLAHPNHLSSSRSNSRYGSDGVQSRNDRLSGSIIEIKSASPSAIAHAIKNGIALPGTEQAKSESRRHVRAASAPQAASHRETEKDLDIEIVTRKPVPVRRLRSADRVGISSAFIYVQAAEHNAKRLSSDSQNRLESAGSMGARRMTFEQVKNKPLPKIAIF